ncbi:MAG: CIA30 family protein [Lutibacter sp.]|nr:CIA30 family protein [Lutibacter sp.]
MVINKSLSIFKFSKVSDVSDWKVVNDTVMGGQSNGEFYLDESGYGVFAGIVSLENNGGFSYLRFRLNKMNILDSQKIKIHLKGDGKKYQFRVKSSQYTQESYISNFETTGKWQTVEILLSSLFPTFRGKKLNLPNFDGEYLEELGFLIGNKKNESFCLLLDTIELAN